MKGSSDHRYNLLFQQAQVRKNPQTKKLLLLGECSLIQNTDTLIPGLVLSPTSRTSLYLGLSSSLLVFVHHKTASRHWFRFHCLPEICWKCKIQQNITHILMITQSNCLDGLFKGLHVDVEKHRDGILWDPTGLLPRGQVGLFQNQHLKLDFCFFLFMCWLIFAHLIKLVTLSYLLCKIFYIYNTASAFLCMLCILIALRQMVMLDGTPIYSVSFWVIML